MIYSGLSVNLNMSKDITHTSFRLHLSEALFCYRVYPPEPDMVWTSSSFDIILFSSFLFLQTVCTRSPEPTPAGAYHFGCSCAFPVHTINGITGQLLPLVTITNRIGLLDHGGRIRHIGAVLLFIFTLYCKMFGLSQGAKFELLMIRDVLYGKIERNRGRFQIRNHPKYFSRSS